MSRRVFFGKSEIHLVSGFGIRVFFIFWIPVWKWSFYRSSWLDDGYYEHSDYSTPDPIEPTDRKSVFPIFSRGMFRHKKRGSTYDVLSYSAKVQDAAGDGLVEGDEAVVYVDTTGEFWIRKRDEFNDGRFTKID